MAALIRSSLLALALAFLAGQLSAETWPGYPAGAEPPPSALSRTDERWASGVFAPPGADRPCRIVGVHDGELIVGGAFEHIGGIDANAIARWDGSAWKPLDEGLRTASGDRGTATALVEYGGELIVGGYFVQAGGISARNIAAWNGSQWRNLASGLNATVYSLVVWNGDLIAGGEFTRSGGVDMPGVARWDGSQWHDLGTGTDNVFIMSLQPYNGDLVAGGWFSAIGDLTTTHVARWDGSQWNAMGLGFVPGAGGSCATLTVRDGELLAGGRLNLAGGPDEVEIAAWDGSSWREYAPGADGYVRTMLEHDGRFFVGSGGTIGGVSTWDGTGWEVVGGGMGQYVLVTLLDVYSLCAYNGDLIAAGDFGYAGGRFAMYVARWDGSRWHPMCGGWGLEGRGRAAVQWGNRLIAGGLFGSAGCDTVSNVAAWDGSDWEALGAGFGGTYLYGVAVLGLYEGDLIAGGDFTRCGDQTVNHIARWDGSQWLALGSGVEEGWVWALAEFDGDLVAGGGFNIAGGLPAHSLAAWNGDTWSPIEGLDESAWVAALTVHDGKLVVGGNFQQAGGLPARNIATWDGQSWGVLGTGIGNPGVDAFAEFGGLIAGGDFQEAGGTTCYGVARWTGTDWTPLGLGTSYPVLDLTVYRGTLVAGGEFSWAGSVYSRGVARWDGVNWSAFGTGVIDPAVVNGVTVYNGDLFVLGNFRYTGQDAWNSSYYIARWSDIPTPVDLLSFTATRLGRDVVLRWREGERRAAGYHVHRATGDAPRVQLTDAPLAEPDGEYEYVDREAPPGTTSYWLHALDGTKAGEWHGPVVVGAVAPGGVPRPLDVHPNPSGAQSTITYELKHDAEVRLRIFDTQGRLVTEFFEGRQGAGSQAVFWDGRDAAGRVVAAGTYYVRLEIDGRETTTRLSVVR